MGATMQMYQLLTFLGNWLVAFACFSFLAGLVYGTGRALKRISRWSEMQRFQIEAAEAAWNRHVTLVSALLHDLNTPAAMRTILIEFTTMLSSRERITKLCSEMVARKAPFMGTEPVVQELRARLVEEMENLTKTNPRLAAAYMDAIRSGLDYVFFAYRDAQVPIYWVISSPASVGQEGFVAKAAAKSASGPELPALACA